MSVGTSLSSAHVAAVAQLACLLEVSAPKPGNVSPGRHFGDLRYEDFLASAIAIGEPLGGAGTRSLGVTVRLAIEASSRCTRSNTNLGIILLLAPLARAVLMQCGSSDESSVVDLRGRVRRVLESTTVEDARDVYVAIRLATPGGMGVVQSQDLSAEPTETLLDVMRLAVARDSVAAEYATGFEITFGLAVPALERARHDGLPWDDAVVETFLTVLASVPDTHIGRRSGAALAVQVTERARTALAAGGVRSAAGRLSIDQMDAALRDARNSGNPGTTADLTAAAIFVTLINGGWESRSRSA
jgi:triphosphoribosyl-dephospho-CoA synthase